jgi:hypothetical protein
MPSDLIYTLWYASIAVENESNNLFNTGILIGAEKH